MQETPVFNLAQAQAWLQAQLSPERYHHSVGTYQKALELADRFACTPEETRQIAIAALLHDAAKLKSPNELLAYAEARRDVLPLTDAERESPQTLHPWVGAEMVRETYGIGDEMILNAIRYHTTGRAGMSRVEKVVYVADKIEGNTRNPLFIQKVAQQIEETDPTSLDRTVLYLLESTLSFLMEKGQLIHPRTIEARNDVLRTLRAQKRAQSPETLETVCAKPCVSENKEGAR